MSWLHDTIKNDPELKAMEDSLQSISARGGRVHLKEPWAKAKK